jgi:glycosyltransferase involved in cell wall biosynthesis
VDNFPNSVLEALASAVPVVSTDVGGIPHLVKHGETALLVAAGDARSMADAMAKLLSDPATAQRLTAAGRALSEQYGWSAIRPLLFSIYHDILSAAATSTSAAATK